MSQFAIVETEAGLTVIEVDPGMTPEEVAARDGSLLIDGGPFAEYDEAYDAMMSLPDDDEPGVE